MAVVWAVVVAVPVLVVVVEASVVAMMVIVPLEELEIMVGWKGHRVCTESNLEKRVVTWVKEEILVNQ